MDDNFQALCTNMYLTDVNDIGESYSRIMYLLMYLDSYLFVLSLIETTLIPMSDSNLKKKYSIGETVKVFLYFLNTKQIWHRCS